MPRIDLSSLALINPTRSLPPCCGVFAAVVLFAGCGSEYLTSVRGVGAMTPFRDSCNATLVIEEGGVWLEMSGAVEVDYVLRVGTLMFHMTLDSELITQHGTYNSVTYSKNKGYRLSVMLPHGPQKITQSVQPIGESTPPRLEDLGTLDI